MKEIALHILDIVENSISAGASRINIMINQVYKNDFILIDIRDNGRGIPRDLLENVTDPFTTSRTTRRVGLGISLFKAAAQRSNGDLLIQSVENKGTALTATFEKDHIDTAPLGDMGGTIQILIAGSSEVDIRYRHVLPKGDFYIDTREIKADLGGIDITTPSVLEKIKEIIDHNINTKRG